MASTTLLKTIPFFKPLTNLELDQLVGETRILNCKKETHLLSRKDSQDRGVYFIVSGRIRVTSYTQGGKEASFNEKYAGEFFGELSAIDALPRTADAIALEDTTLVVLDHSCFNRLLHTHASLSQSLIESLVLEIRSLTQRVYEYSALDVRFRIIAEICRLSAKVAVSGDAVSIADFPTHAEIASRVATTREAVTRELARLNRLGLLVKNGNALSVPSLMALQSILPDS